MYYAVLSFFVVFFRQGVVKNNKSMYLLISLILFLTASLADPLVRKDGQSYVGYYFRVVSNGYLEIEPTFILISHLSNFLAGSYVALFLIYAFIGVVIKAYSISRISIFPFASLYIYFSYFFFLHENAQIRVGAAASFLFLAFYCYNREEVFRFYAFVLVASLFHYSSLLFLFLPFLINRRQGFILCIMWISLSLFFAFLHFFGVGVYDVVLFSSNLDPTGKLSFYTNALSSGRFDEINFSNRLAPYGFFLIPLLVKWKVAANRDPVFTYVMQLTCIGLFMFSFLSQIPVLAYRISDLFLMFSIFALPYYMVVFKSKVFASLAILSYGMMNFVYLHEVVGFI